jgi:PEGA domain-containing protein
MKRVATLAALLAVIALGAVLASCGHCLALPCPMPMALVINITAGAAGGPVSGAVVRVTGATVTTVPCNATCDVPGYGGTYNLEVEAPGFQTAHRTVTVDGTDPECGCPSTATRRLDIALVASP